jgi:hypothetical protein
MRLAAGILSGPRSGAWDNHSPLLLCAIRGRDLAPDKTPVVRGRVGLDDGDARRARRWWN